MRLGIMVVLVIIGLPTVGSFPKRVEGVFGIQMDPCIHSVCTEACKKALIYIYIYIYIYNFLLIQIKLFYFY